MKPFGIAILLSTLTAPTPFALPITLVTSPTLVQQGSPLIFDLDLTLGLEPDQILAGILLQFAASDDLESQVVGFNQVLAGFGPRTFIQTHGPGEPLLNLQHVVVNVFPCGNPALGQVCRVVQYTVYDVPRFTNVPVYGLLPDPGNEGMWLTFDGSSATVPVVGGLISIPLEAVVREDRRLQLTVGATVGDFLLNHLMVDVLGTGRVPDVESGVAAVPEPSSMATFALGSLLVLAGWRRRCRFLPRRMIEKT